MSSKVKDMELVLTVGSRIRYMTWSGELQEAKVQGIEICAHGEKEGRPVKRCRYRLHGNGVVDLVNGHWCYFNQIKEVLS